ncbi:MAG: DUF4190 domain-containing protein [Planctomycetia bacterium]|nr:DUF4190 domain-containing protein [Planctomycetia bacterium]
MTTVSTTRCPQCGTELWTQGISPDRTVLCARCGASLYLPLPPDTRRTSRKALASVALGVTSIALTVLTGLPAILLGFLAWRDIRRREEELKGRGLAYAGMALGTVFGLLCWPCMIAMMVPGVLQMRAAVAQQQAIAQNWQPPLVQSTAAQIGSLSLPLALKPFQSATGPGADMREASFQVTNPAADVFVLMVSAGPATPSPLKAVKERLGEWAVVSAMLVDERSQLTWMVDGAPRKIYTYRGMNFEDRKPQRRYVVLIEEGASVTALMISTWEKGPPPPPVTNPSAGPTVKPAQPGPPQPPPNPPDPSVNLTEEEVRQIFESFRRAGSPAQPSTTSK